MKRKEQLESLEELDDDQLRVQTDDLKESLFRMKFRKSLGVGEVVGDIRREKKILARAYTIMRRREIEAAKAEAEKAEA